MIVGIDASRNRSGGAKAHLIGIINELDPVIHRFTKIHVWSYRSLLDSLPDHVWLVKHCPDELDRSIFHQAWWQYRHLPQLAHEKQCDIMLYTDAGAILGNFRPSVVMSRDMLSYEKGEMHRFGFSRARIRLILLKYFQAYSMKKADGVIFLTHYASRVIQAFTGKLANTTVVNHGVGDVFRTGRDLSKEDWQLGKKIHCIYVSNTSMYKHQWHVVRAISMLRQEGYSLDLTLVGGGKGPAQQLLREEMKVSDPEGIFVKQLEFVKHEKIPELMAAADLFVFASSCENMPNTLVEGMAAGLPIASSNRGPMPEVLEDAGLYFDPENPQSIADAVRRLIDDEALRKNFAQRAKAKSVEYSWTRCAGETFSYLRGIYKNQKKDQYHKTIE